jgi:hypothetical protein
MGSDDAPRHRARRHVPGLPAARSHQCAPEAQRAAGRRPADPHARARSLLPKRSTSSTSSSPPTIPRSPWPTPRSPRSPPTSITSFNGSAPRSAPSDRSSPTRSASSRKDLDIREYTDPNNDPMIPHTRVLKPGLVIHGIYNGELVLGRVARTQSQSIGGWPEAPLQPGGRTPSTRSPGAEPGRPSDAALRAVGQS